MARVTLVETDKFNQFLDWVLGSGSIRVVRLTDYGFTEPVRKNGGWVMQPKVRLVATAYDEESDKLFRWAEDHEAGSTITINAFTGKGKHSERKVAWQKQRIHELLMLKGLGVEDGEWDLETIRTLLKA